MRLETAVGADRANRATERGCPFHFDVLGSFIANRRLHRGNVRLFQEAMARQAYDLVIGDETYEILMALRDRQVELHVPFLMLYDFIGVDVERWRPLDCLAAYLINRRWAYGYRRAPDVPITTCFIGEIEDVTYPRIPVDGAQRLADLARSLLGHRPETSGPTSVRASFLGPEISRK